MRTKLFTFALVLAFCGAAFATTLTTEAGRLNYNAAGDNPMPDASECLIFDSGNIVNAWGWIEGYEYHIAASHFLQYGGTIDSASVALTDWRGSVNHNFDMTIWEDADNDGSPDNVLYTEYKDEIVGDWPDVTTHWIYPGIAVTEAWYWIGFTPRNYTFEGGAIDDGEDYPDQNWYWDGSNWYSGDLYGGDHVQHICYTFTEPDITLECGSGGVACPNASFIFWLTVGNNTGGDITVPAVFSAYSGYDCQGSPLIAIPRNKTYPAGSSTTYYYFNVPGFVSPGQYSVKICLTYNGVEYCCCMNVDVIDCGPW